MTKKRAKKHCNEFQSNRPQRCEEALQFLRPPTMEQKRDVDPGPRRPPTPIGRLATQCRPGPGGGACGGGGSLEESDQIHSNNKSTPKRGKIQWKRRWHMPNFAKLMINVEKVRLVFLFQHQKNNNNNERTEIPMKFAVTFVLLVFLSLHPSKTTNILTRSF